MIISHKDSTMTDRDGRRVRKHEFQVHRLGEILGILPLKELDAILCVRCTAEGTVCCAFLVFRLADGKGHLPTLQAGNQS